MRRWTHNSLGRGAGARFQPFVAYWWYAGKPYARTAAITWSLFGMADLINAVAIGFLLGGSGIVFPIVLIPIYAVPRASRLGRWAGLCRFRHRADTGEW